MYTIPLWTSLNTAASSFVVKSNTLIFLSFSPATTIYLLSLDSMTDVIASRNIYTMSFCSQIILGKASFILQISFFCSISKNLMHLSSEPDIMYLLSFEMIIDGILPI